ncbi:unnamed protein product, partial [Lymnaea stagnalis]
MSHWTPATMYGSGTIIEMCTLLFVGREGSGKSSVGNAILGQDDDKATFETRWSSEVKTLKNEMAHHNDESFVPECSGTVSYCMRLGFCVEILCFVIFQGFPLLFSLICFAIVIVVSDQFLNLFIFHVLRIILEVIFNVFPILFVIFLVFANLFAVFHVFPILFAILHVFPILFAIFHFCP